MSLLIALTIAIVAGYLKITLTEEVEAMFAGLVAFVCAILSIIFAPLLLKLFLLAILLKLPEANLV